jgi:hypothetical protein
LEWWLHSIATLIFACASDDATFLRLSSLSPPLQKFGCFPFLINFYFWKEEWLPSPFNNPWKVDYVLQNTQTCHKIEKRKGTYSLNNEILYLWYLTIFTCGIVLVAKSWWGHSKPTWSLLWKGNKPQNGCQT